MPLSTFVTSVKLLVFPFRKYLDVLSLYASRATVRSLLGTTSQPSPFACEGACTVDGSAARGVLSLLVSCVRWGGTASPKPAHVVHDLVEVHSHAGVSKVLVVARIVDELGDFIQPKLDEMGSTAGQRSSLTRVRKPSELNECTCFAFFPKTKRSASITLDLPLPLGPTTEEKDCTSPRWVNGVSKLTKLMRGDGSGDLPCGMARCAALRRKT